MSKALHHNLPQQMFILQDQCLVAICQFRCQQTNTQFQHNRYTLLKVINIYTSLQIDTQLLPSHQ